MPVDMKKALAAMLAAFAALLLLAVRHLERPAEPAPVSIPHSAPRPETVPAAPVSREAPPAIALGDPALERQVALVIESMDRTGHPPEGVAQGGRRSGRRGVFENAEGHLPRQAGGYYTETDVWPRGAGGRGARRLIFGRGGEVYYTGDHYRTFVRVR
jgi:guanyl-specific ribonuclease Sa